MIAALDSAVVVAALREDEAHHTECIALLRQPELHIRAHALAETFSTLTGGRLGERLPADEVTLALQRTILPRVTIVHLAAEDYVSAMSEARLRGVRGGAIHDYLHLVAARKVVARRLYTLNVSHFQSFHRAGDPEIVHP